VSTRMQGVVFRREYPLVAVVRLVTHIRFDQPVARVPRMAHQFASHMSVFHASECFQKKVKVITSHPLPVRCRLDIRYICECINA
jgi:hypothetical protein